MQHAHQQAARDPAIAALKRALEQDNAAAVAAAAAELCARGVTVRANMCNRTQSIACMAALLTEYPARRKNGVRCMRRCCAGTERTRQELANDLRGAMTASNVADVTTVLALLRGLKLDSEPFQWVREALSHALFKPPSAHRDAQHERAFAVLERVLGTERAAAAIAAHLAEFQPHGWRLVDSATVTALTSLLFCESANDTVAAQRVVAMLVARGASAAIDLTAAPGEREMFMDTSPHVVRALMAAGWDAQSEGALRWALHFLEGVVFRSGHSSPDIAAPGRGRRHWPPRQGLVEWARWGGSVPALHALARAASVPLIPEVVHVLRCLAPEAAWARRRPLMLLRGCMRRAFDAGEPWGTL
jgi:hypothetical protein